MEKVLSTLADIKTKINLGLFYVITFRTNEITLQGHLNSDTLSKSCKIAEFDRFSSDNSMVNLKSEIDGITIVITLA